METKQLHRDSYWFVTVTNEKLAEWWPKIANTPSELAMAEAESFERFSAVMNRSAAVVEFPFGVGRMEDNGKVHGFFWSPGVIRSPDVVSKAIRETARRLRIGRVWVIIPKRSRVLRKLVSQWRFFFMGSVAECYDGKTQVPASCYGMEVEDG